MIELNENMNRDLNIHLGEVMSSNEEPLALTSKGRLHENVEETINVQIEKTCGNHWNGCSFSELATSLGCRMCPNFASKSESGIGWKSFQRSRVSTSPWDQ